MNTTNLLGLNSNERGVIKRLVDYVANNPTHKTSDIWSCFSRPELSRKISDNLGVKHDITFSKIEKDSLASAKIKLTKYLAKICLNRCSYCKRPMGNYGWSWHIEHVKCKQHHRNATFLLENFTLACVDCNYRKASGVDRPNRFSDIINPNSVDFNYKNHLKMNIHGNEVILSLSFFIIDRLGSNTYELLKLKNLEYSTTLRSINQSIDILLGDIDRVLIEEPKDENEERLMSLLNELKTNLIER
ncbi:TPA: HNH endonuclease [Klebsiella michiganensis]|uniref:HNH endonuclease n=1 Tax=Klebsiella michiganensis TaxID=1134687 RepID=UPI001C8CE542|nr:HNH endonuclease [Klebsiella michiganensis]MBX8830050.1 hypothetical protein [Klebsiella michiganensis]MBX8848115.1 hypothetical protein [Klebsiella michiganensis]MBX8868578.1 hypothetical protein [Klebsiella michiganensis]MCW9467873.1 HNH endonuclease [Klebsiella michiganensis]HEJ8714332.1 HNH endonuclease [Klebsiella michiganensis]